MEINPDILNYIQQYIIPQYVFFDKAHNLEHVNKVIKNSLAISLAYKVDINKVYIIAAYHDVGLSYGRESHEKSSAVYLRSDDKLKEWFSEEEMVAMSEAIEDHRASNDYEPRSIYGKIVAEADRDIECERILTRVIQYSLKNYPDYDFEKHLTRCYEHLCDKYSEGGYLKLWLSTESNERNLQELRSMITSKEKLRPDFERIFLECTE